MTAPKTRKRPSLQPAPTTPDPIEIAMAAEASGVAPQGVALEVLRRQAALLGWQIASERAGFALKIGMGVAALAWRGRAQAAQGRAHDHARNGRILGGFSN